MDIIIKKVPFWATLQVAKLICNILNIPTFWYMVKQVWKCDNFNRIRIHALQNNPEVEIKMYHLVRALQRYSVTFNHYNYNPIEFKEVTTLIPSIYYNHLHSCILTTDVVVPKTKTKPSKIKNMITGKIEVFAFHVGVPKLD